MGSQEQLRALHALVYSREAGGVKRCHTWSIIGETNVGQHTYNAAMIYLIFHPDPQILTLWEIMTHDSGERVAGDLPRTAKWASEKLRDEYEDLEDSARIKNGLPPADLSDYEAMWVAACDALEFACFCRDQENLGNRLARPRFENARGGIRNMMAMGKFPHELTPVYQMLEQGMPIHNEQDLT